MHLLKLSTEKFTHCLVFVIKRYDPMEPCQNKGIHCYFTFSSKTPKLCALINYIFTESFIFLPLLNLLTCGLLWFCCKKRKYSAILIIRKITFSKNAILLYFCHVLGPSCNFSKPILYLWKIFINWISTRGYITVKRFSM